MQNETGEFVDMYIPRKCSASNRIIAAKDHASIQINIADVDPTTGRMTGSNTTYAICGNNGQEWNIGHGPVSVNKQNKIL